MTNNNYVEFMRDLELRYKKISGLTDRSQYKIFYGPVRPAQILVLGINPGGDPAKTEPNGLRHKTGEIAAASASFYENDECDLLDCDWKENKGLKKLLLPLFDGSEKLIRHQVVKTNLAFKRSPKITDIDIKAAKQEATPFLMEIIYTVQPQLVILTGGTLKAFLEQFSSKHIEATKQIRDENVKQTVFEAAYVNLHGCKSETLVVRVAHASQFSWTYERYNIVKRIRDLSHGYSHGKL